MDVQKVFLFELLDDIDTASDIAKDNDAWFRRRVETLIKRRWQIADSDGHSLLFNDVTPLTRHAANSVTSSDTMIYNAKPKEPS